MPRTIIALPLLLLLAALGRAAEQAIPLPLLAPQEQAAAEAPAKGPAGEAALEIVGGAAATTTPVAVAENPPNETHVNAVRGKEKYENVANDGYLELWNVFGDRGEYFTRSLADSGPLGKLSGTSDWREFELPFYAKPGMHPTELRLNVVLPGTGTVTIAQPVLVPLGAGNGWWTERQAGFVGGGLGSLVGILGGLIGLTTAWGKSRHLTLALFAAGISISGIALVLGIAAIVVRQPWHVYYPLLLVGMIGVTVLGFNLWQLLGRYRSDELRRIVAIDA
jgi:hypothetical protein